MAELQNARATIPAGATLLYPESEPYLWFDPTRRVVVDRRDNRHFAIRLWPREERPFFAGIYDGERCLVDIFGYSIEADRPGFGPTQGFLIDRISLVENDRPVRELSAREYDAKPVADFLNKHEDARGTADRIGNAVVVDARRLGELV